MTFNFDLTVTMGVIVTVVLAIVGWVHSRQKRNDDATAAITARIDRHEARIVTVEQTVTGLPGKDDIHALHLSLEGFRGDLREVRAAQSAMTESVQRNELVTRRLEQYLLDRAGKS